MALVVKNLPADAENIRLKFDQSLKVSEEPLEEGTATHSSSLVWRISWTEELACTHAFTVK